MGSTLSKTPAMLAAGTRIADRYRLLRPLSSGGMGCVWVARHELLGIDVAIKFLLRDCHDDEAAGRLLQEARTAARIDHPAIVRVIDLVLEQSEPFVVMELLHGESLADLLDREGRLEADYAVRLLLPIVDALVAAHERCVVHRDVKPANIILAEGSGTIQPKLIDFGISRLGFSSRTTQVGLVMGTPEYMAPEQVRARGEIDGRADVWALSALLYECIAGIPPFRGADHLAVFDRVLLAEPTPLGEIADCDRALWAIVRRGLSKDLEHRWQSASELGTELASWLLSHGVKEDVTGRALRSGFPLARADVDVAYELRPVDVLVDGDIVDCLPNAERASPGPPLTQSVYSADNAVELPARSKKSQVVAMIVGAIVGAILTGVTLMELDRAARLGVAQPLARAVWVPSLVGISWKPFRLPDPPPTETFDESDRLVEAAVGVTAPSGPSAGVPRRHRQGGEAAKPHESSESAPESAPSEASEITVDNPYRAPDEFEHR